MNLRQELEILRGEPILDKVQASAVPYNETSDSSRLCKDPVVSVRMITYNHEKYIAQAIEGVMMQQADFEYELIISDDCSKDRTRQIAEEFQMRYPDKIRVLWWTENQFKFGGNGLRAWAACRGEFVALCEGDDYWIDPLKLQKQVDAMRRHPNVSVCFCRMQRYFQDSGKVVPDPGFDLKWPEGVSDGRRLATSDYVIPTQTAMLRTSVYKLAYKKFEILRWRLSLGDFQLFTAMSLLGDVYCHHDLMATYRIHGGSAMATNHLRIDRDAAIASLYFIRSTDGWSRQSENSAVAQLGCARIEMIAAHRCLYERRHMLSSLKPLEDVYPTIFNAVGHMGLLMARLGLSDFLEAYIKLRRGVKSRFPILGRIF